MRLIITLTINLPLVLALLACDSPDDEAELQMLDMEEARAEVQEPEVQTAEDAISTPRTP